eukprot:PITA_04975
MSRCVVTEPSSFEEVVQQLIWVDATVLEYDSIVRNSVLNVVPRLEDNSMVSSYWTYKVKQVVDGSMEKHKDRFVMGWKIHHIDLNKTFLNGTIEEEVHIEHPKGFETFDRGSHVCRPKRVLYGMKKEPHAWYTRLDSYFTRLGFTKSEEDENLYPHSGGR